MIALAFGTVVLAAFAWVMWRLGHDDQNATHCVCGCPRDRHEHYHDGTYCGTCASCREFKAAGKPLPLNEDSAEWADRFRSGGW